MNNLMAPKDKKAAFFDLYFSSANLHELVCRASELLQNPLIVYNVQFRVLASSNIDLISDPYWREYVQQGYCTYEYASYVMHDEHIQQMRRNDTPFQVYCSISKNRKIASEIYYNDKQIATVLMSECQRPFTSEDIDHMADVAYMVGDMIKKEIPESAFALNEDLLFGLLNRAYNDKEEFTVQLKFLDISMPDELILLVFDLSENRGNEWILNSLIQQTPLCKLSVPYQGYLTVLTSSQELQRKTEQLTAFCKEHRLTVAVGDAFKDPLDTRKHFSRALTTLHHGKRIYPEQDILYAHQTTYFATLPEKNTSLAYEEFAHPVLKRLRAYDEEYHSTLYKTLFTYLLSNQKIQLAADKLFLHRNTMRYHIAKIIEIGQADLEDVYEVNDILLSYRILRYYGITD
jgi:hypothetical protein